VLISAGFDAHRADPMADLALSAGDFAALTRQVQAFAPAPGRTIAFLEGGYDLTALQLSVTATVRSLAGLVTDTEPQTAGGPGLTQVDQARRFRTDRLEVMA
jgi:acetoin utilization deacetylase AcuC-like enzyme